MADSPRPAGDTRHWADFIAAPALMMPRKELIGPDTKVFTMGSCFALEVRRALERRNIAVYPDYRRVRYQLDRSQFSSFTEHCEFQPHYDTYGIKQEFETALGLWPDRRLAYVKFSGTPTNARKGWETVYQDPFRKVTWARTPELLMDLTDQIDAVVTEGLEQSDVVVLTLGLTEVWRSPATGRYFCQTPRHPDLAEFRASKFLENYNNVRETLDMLFAKFPKKQVILSVSPVPLAQTFRKMDVATANTESKAILRAVAGQICEDYPSNVTYFPSYEMATCLGIPVYQEDRRHILPEFADGVVKGFLDVFSRP